MISCDVMSFIREDFLLGNAAAKRLYSGFAASQPCPERSSAFQWRSRDPGLTGIVIAPDYKCDYGEWRRN